MALWRPFTGLKLKQIYVGNDKESEEEAHDFLAVTKNIVDEIIHIKYTGGLIAAPVDHTEGYRKQHRTGDRGGLCAHSC